ncbi:hypothetical protein [Bacillus tropicus]|uniref:hypothetical protein n=1 Tax=Bacillus tropicus TaxID=2026188 RepID=UPI003D9AA963
MDRNTEFNNNNNNEKLSPKERAKKMKFFLEKLSNMEYSDYLPEESYRVYEQLRGKSSE